MEGSIVARFKPQNLNIDVNKLPDLGDGQDSLSGEQLEAIRAVFKDTEISHLSAANHINNNGYAKWDCPSQTIRIREKLEIDLEDQILVIEGRYKYAPISVWIHCWVSDNPTGKRRLKSGLVRSGEEGFYGLVVPDPSKADPSRMRIVVQADTFARARKCLFKILSARLVVEPEWLI